MAQPRHKEIVVWGDNEARIKTIQTWFPPGSVRSPPLFYFFNF